MRSTHRSSRHYRGRSRQRGGALALVLIVIGALVAGCIAWGAFALVHTPPAPKLAMSLSSDLTVPGKPLALTAPSGVEEAVAIDGVGLMASTGGERPTPIASLTKMMSALVILHDHPLTPLTSGPAITVTQADVSTYQQERRAGDSVVAVSAGEQLSELQALEAALIPSGDNVVQLLATWDAGSVPAFTAKMNALAHSLGLSHTHYAGPSGVDPATVSTAQDQLRLAEVAMRNAVFAKIVSMPQVTLPVAGVQYNVDSDLGTDGIDGIKTGWIPAGGASFVFSATHKFDGQKVRVLGAVVGEQGRTPLPTALAVAQQIVLASEKTLQVFRLDAGTKVATVSAPYAKTVQVVSTASMSVLAWSGARVSVNLRDSARLTGNLNAGSVVGTLAIQLGEAHAATSAHTTSQLPSPSLTWRLEHP